MEVRIHIGKRFALMVAAAVALAAVMAIVESGRTRGQATNTTTPENSAAKSSKAQPAATLELTPTQLSAIKVEPV